jgi:glycosyltransferase involved in cell wall biosynthesis
LNYGHSTHQQHIDIPFLSDSDLEHAYKNAHALVFGSFFEGFGYPPIEAMRYNTPCVASNVTSIPEILGNAGIYFSPFYPADLYRAIKEVLNDRDCRHEQMQHRYVEVSERQREDLKLLVNEIFQKGK